MQNQSVPETPERHASRTWPVMCHLLALIGMLVLAVPVGSVLDPLILWLARRADDPEVELHGRESLNFQLSVAIYLAVLGCIAFLAAGFMMVPVLGLPAIPVLFLLALMGVAIGIADLILIIIASVRTGEGETYQYPFNLRLIR